MTEMVDIQQEQNTRKAERAFTFSLIVSGIRCTLMYIVLPFVLPVIGITGAFASQIDIAINLVAMGALIYSVRRFWQINYEWKLLYTLVAIVAFVILAVFIALDLRALGVFSFTL
ncbi:MAG: hypothetical protein UZ15_CFX003000101 [Chloroflexi bacterium OLB15]|nr:MAG: hypothetical protein UZ15_CFX003000101 [Chloroflexi bacterium OLB15]